MRLPNVDMHIRFLVPKLRLGTGSLETLFRIAARSYPKRSFEAMRSQTEFRNEGKVRCYPWFGQAFLGISPLGCLFFWIARLRASMSAGSIGGSTTKIAKVSVDLSMAVSSSL